MPADDANGRQGLRIEISGAMPEWDAFHDFIETCLRQSAQDLTLKNTEISVHLCNDGEMASLNETYRGKKGPTNVLSFAPAGMKLSNAPEHLLGDIVLAYETITREATEQAKPFEAHLAHLLVHGLLHLLGHDHQDDAEAALMEGQEIHLLAAMGFANPYDAAHEAGGAETVSAAGHKG